MIIAFVVAIGDITKILNMSRGSMKNAASPLHRLRRSDAIGLGMMLQNTP
jgi:hypothetical protein